MTQDDDDDDDEISRREKVGRSVGVELVKPASRLTRRRLVSSRRRRLPDASGAVRPSREVDARDEARRRRRDETVCFEDLEDDAMG